LNKQKLSKREVEELADMIKKYKEENEC